MVQLTNLIVAYASCAAVFGKPVYGSPIYSSPLASRLIWRRDDSLTSACTNRTFEKGILTAKCSKTGSKCTSISLNKCIGNKDGHLVPSIDGGYDDSCRGCVLPRDNNVTATLECHCARSPHGTNYTLTALNLDTVIRVTNLSTLACFDKPGQIVSC
ncbi:hypothetical protein F4780DRAFT_46792 [Xylariomycetidae sp. FL0641]|nr:hypothetical protein F4780DRAFT_46792 [Xylariomycetidae sp. FL0641]